MTSMTGGVGRTATFVLGDVVGSTRLWAEAGTSMPDALAHLDALIDTAAARHNGERPIEQGEGDSFVVTFARATDALAFAIDVQRGLSEPNSLSVRMAIHTGDAERRDDGRWLGPVLNRCARLRALAAGGQVLVSAATSELTVDTLPERASLRDLGRHRLRDLGSPEHVRQLCHPDLGADFPPLASLDRVPNNLPLQLTSFVGREAELEALDELLADRRLVTLTGAGGCGKTRLAVHAAARWVDDVEGGVWVADLAGVVDPALVAHALATAIGLPEQPLQPMADTIAARFYNVSALVVLDNCEHLLESCAALVGKLLSSCPGVRVLATSREPLGVDGEVVYRVPSLGLPVGDDDTACESVRLFVERAATVRAGFSLDDKARAPVLELCRRLDGLPLAIELAAARCRAMSPAEIAEQLGDRLDLLSAGRRAALPRQRTLEASVQWSHDLLSDAECTLLRRLSVFAAGFTLAGAERVGARDDVDPWHVVDLLTGLVDRSLVQVEDAGDRTRYRLLETIRVFAAQRLADAGETTAARDRHLGHMIDEAEALGGKVHGVGVPIGAFTLELDNLRAALDWAVATGQGDLAFRMFAPNFNLWATWYHQEAYTRASSLWSLEGGRPIDRALVAALGTQNGALLGDMAGAGRYAEAITAIAEETGDELIRGWALCATGTLRLLEADPSALDLSEAAVALLEPLNDRELLIDAFVFGAIGLAECGRLAEAGAWADRAFAVAEAAGSDFLKAFANDYRAMIALQRGDFAEAELLAEAARLPVEPNAVTMMSPLVAGFCRSAQGDHDIAVAMLDERVAEARRYALAVTLAAGGNLTAWARLRAGHLPDEAAIAETETICELMGFRWGAPRLEAVLAEHALAAGDLGEAAARVREAEALVESSPFARLALPSTRRTAARVALATGDVTRAADKAYEALASAIDTGTRWCTAEALETIAQVAAALESPAEAARLAGGAAAIRARIGWVPGVPEAVELATLADRLSAELGAEGYAAARAEGEAMPQDEVIGYAQRGRGERKRPSFGWASLTPTENEVARLVAEGLANKAIAEKLFMSPATVKTHLTHVYAKLAVANRAELAAQATQRSSS